MIQQADAARVPAATIRRNPGRPDFGTRHSRLASKASRRGRPLVEVALAFGAAGALPEGLYDRARAGAENEGGV